MKIYKKLSAIFIMMVLSFSLFGCGSVKQDVTQKNYEGRTFYEIFVRSFRDSNGDGIGDLNGVTEKLDYLQDLGVKGIWLMPIFKSNSYHGYDTVDYYSLQQEYGSMEDLDNLIEEAHKRDIKVILDLVINHTSTECEWFKEAREDENSKYRNYYIFDKDMSKKNELTSMNTKRWNQNGEKNELYYSIFDKGMPDLNMDNQDTVNAVKDVAKFYLDKGIDGFRLDAAKWIYESTDKNVAFWTDFNKFVKSQNSDAILVGEVWDNSTNILSYTKCLDSCFEFSVGDNVKDRVNSNSISKFPDSYKSVDNNYKASNEDFVPAPFLSNHDGQRIMSALSDNFKMKKAAAMYLFLPGTPFIYYGEETGTEGYGKDENKRQPFIWSADDKSQNASWEGVTSDINKVAEDKQEEDEKSILNFYKDLLKVKNEYKSLRYGTVDSLEGKYDNNVMAMVREYDKETSYIIINGNNKNENIPIPKGKYDVLYSSEGRDEKTVKSKDNLEVKSQEILIIAKNK